MLGLASTNTRYECTTIPVISAIGMSERGIREISESTRVPENGLSGKKGDIPQCSAGLNP
jgi:hypothetical protein